MAEYPRIIVDDEVVNFLKAPSGYSRDPQIDENSAKMGEICRSLLVQDTDGKMIVDFIGMGMYDLYKDNVGGLVELITAVNAFVTDERAKFELSANKKLGDRYARLDEYIKARLPIWGL